MTPREMTAEELAVLMVEVANALGEGVADRIFAHCDALRARAEAAEADNAALLHALREMHEVAVGAMPHADRERRRWDAHDALDNPHPGTGYRAKVRAELLRELAKERREHATSLRAMGVETSADSAESLARVYDARAAREEQG